MQFKYPLAACVAGVAGLAFTAGAFAQDNVPQDKRFYVAPMVSYGFFGHDRFDGHPHAKNGDSIGGQLSFGKPINKWLNLEAYGFYYRPDVKVGAHHLGHTDMYGFGLDALFFPARDTLPVYGVLGGAWGKGGDLAAAATKDTLDNTDARFLDAGVGYMYTLNDYGMKVRAEYRYRYTELDGSPHNAHTNDNIVSLGLQIPFGAPPSAPTPEPAPVAPAPKVEKPAPVVLKGVNFHFDSAQLTGQATHRLNNVVDALDASPGIDFRIDGYTDSTGPAQYNLGLSQRRVESVQDYLTGHGISDNRVSAAVGHGENDPVATNETKEGRAQNRRVELTVTNQGDSAHQGDTVHQDDTVQ